MTADVSTTDSPQPDAAHKRRVWNGWVLLVASLLIPLLGLWASWVGYTLRHTNKVTAWVLMPLGITICVVRMAIYLA